MNQHDCQIYSSIFVNSLQNNELTRDTGLEEQGREWVTTRASWSGVNTPLAYPYSNTQVPVHEEYQWRNSRPQKPTLEPQTRWSFLHHNETLDPKTLSHQDTVEKPTDNPRRVSLSTNYERKSG